MPALHYMDPAKEHYWREHLQKQAASGLTAKAYCTREGLKYRLFADWIRRLHKRDRLPHHIRGPERVDWLKVIEEARAHPNGVANYLQERGIDQKLYYRRFRKLKKAHPEWTVLTRGGRKKGGAPSATSKQKPSTARRPAALTPEVVKSEFVPVRLLPASATVPTPPERTHVEILLPNGVSIKAATDCSIEFLSSLAEALE